MFSLSYTTKNKVQGTLKLTRDPFYYGLGMYKDEDGVKWDIHGVIGRRNQRSYVQARKESDAPSYYGTGMHDTQCGHHKWLPYYVEVVSGQKTGVRYE